MIRPIPLSPQGAREGARGITLTELAIAMGIFAIVMLGVVGTWSKTQEAYFVGSEVAEAQQNVRTAIDFMVRELRSTGRDVTNCAFDYDATASSFLDCSSGKVSMCGTRLAGTGPPAYDTNNGLGGTGCQNIFAIPAAEAQQSQVRIRSDRNSNGRIAGRNNDIDVVGICDGSEDCAEEDVIYNLATTCPSGVPGACITRDDGTGPVAMVAVDITGFTLTYFPRPGFPPCLTPPCTTAFTLPMTQQQADNVAMIGVLITARQVTAGQTITKTMSTDVMLRNRR
jgi:type II secretory pathway pseudopilin PulG